MDWLIYRLGLVFGRRFRIWYWRRTEGWHWGIRRMINELPPREPSSDYVLRKLKEERERVYDAEVILRRVETMCLHGLIGADATGWSPLEAIERYHEKHRRNQS